MSARTLVRFAAATLLAICAGALFAQMPKSTKNPNPQAANTASGAWLFIYFKEPGNQGIYFALSRDGYHYTPLNDGQPWVAPAQAGDAPAQKEELMRDVFLTRGPDGLFHMVWTWNWRGNSLGYASSPDLLTWSAQKQVPIMADFPGTNNVWAPETYWDAAKKQWLLIWSSSMKDSQDGNRIWFSLTPDFQAFSKSAIFFDPGYVTIDATIFHGATGLYRLIFKQQTYDPLTFQERVATGPTLEGPWSNIRANQRKLVGRPISDSGWQTVHCLLRPLSRAACTLRSCGDNRLEALAGHHRANFAAALFEARELSAHYR
jgi:hypothetical protein